MHETNFQTGCFTLFLDDFAGRATVATNLVATKGQISDMWVNLEDTDTGRALVSLSWLQVQRYL